MSRQRTEIDVLEHPAVRAWQNAAGRDAVKGVVAVERLQKKPKGQVYRLSEAGPHGSIVIAKRSSRERICAERNIYQSVLTDLPVSCVKYLGSVDDMDADSAWLFLEDAAGNAYSRQCLDHRILAARWLAALHTSARTCAAASLLPRRDGEFYRQQLLCARDELLANLSNPVLGREDADLLRNIIAQCKIADANWPQVEEWSAAAPETLVHADFAPKNIRVRGSGSSMSLLPFDWGSAGWGSVAVDLPQASTGDPWDYWADPEPETYAAAMRLGAEDVRLLSLVGKLFRSLICIRLEAPSFACNWVEHAAADMKIYHAAMAYVIRSAGWEP